MDIADSLAKARPRVNPEKFVCNCGGQNALNKSTLIFKCPCIVVWFGNLPPPFILPPPFRILNGGGLLNGGARFPNQTNPTFKHEKRMIESVAFNY